MSSTNRKSATRASAYAPRAIVGIICLTAGVAFFDAACSLGEGFTPDCDPNAAPGSDKACREVAQCDTGNGGIAKDDLQCCLQAGGLEYGVCIGERVTDAPNYDFRTACPDAATSACCGVAHKIFDLCMKGLLNTGGGGGTGGSGGGGTGGTGGGMGGGGMSGGGMGGVGGSGGSGGSGG